MAQHLEGDWLELATVSGNSIMVLKAAHPRARRLRLTVTPKGARVSYPHGTHPAQVNAFLRSHADWLEQKLDELNLIVNPLPPLRVGYPPSSRCAARRRTLDWAEGPYPRIEPTHDRPDPGHSAPAYPRAADCPWPARLASGSR
jgi:predicted metal-dependent hydrolase